MRAYNTLLWNLQVRRFWVSSTREHLLLTLPFPLYARWSLLCYSYLPYNGSGTMALTGGNSRSKKWSDLRSGIFRVGKDLWKRVIEECQKVRPFFLSSLLSALATVGVVPRQTGARTRPTKQHGFWSHCCYLLTINNKSVFSISSTRSVSLLCLQKHTNTIRRVIFILHLASRMIHPCSGRGRPYPIPQASQYVFLCRCLLRPPSSNVPS